MPVAAPYLGAIIALVGAILLRRASLRHKINASCLALYPNTEYAVALHDTAKVSHC